MIQLIVLDLNGNVITTRDYTLETLGVLRKQSDLIQQSWAKRYKCAVSLQVKIEEKVEKL